MATQKDNREACPTCLGKKGIEKKGVGNKIIEEIRDVGSEWESSKVTDGQIGTPDKTRPTCNGKRCIGK